MLKTLSWTLVLASLCACSPSKILTLSNQGHVSPYSFNSEIAFRYVKDHLFIDVEIDGEVYNFLFDTGFDFTVVDQSIQPEGFEESFEVTTTGSSFEDQKVPYGTIPGVSINDVHFQNVGVGVMDLDFINEDYICERRVDEDI